MALADTYMFPSLEAILTTDLRKRLYTDESLDISQKTKSANTVRIPTKFVSLKFAKLPYGTR